MEALYDLIFDPNETNNVVEDPALQTVRHELQTRLARWMQTTDDPLQYGPVPAPPGADVQQPPLLSETS
jgi:hypothetical protein